MSLFSRGIMSVIASVGFVASLSSSALAQDSEVQVVPADINSALQLDVEQAFQPSPWMLDNGNNTDNSLQLRAYANVSYGLQHNCDGNPTKATAGAENNLFEFDLVNGVYAVTSNLPEGGAGKFITADITYAEDGSVGIATDTNPVNLPGASGEATTLTAGRIHAIRVEQAVDFGDKSLVAVPSVYLQVMTFTILPGI